MHAFLLPHSLSQPTMRLWIRHILAIVLPVFIMDLRNSFLHPLRNILFPNLQNLSISIVFDTYVVVVPVYCLRVMFLNSSSSLCTEFTSGRDGPIRQGRQHFFSWTRL